MSVVQGVVETGGDLSARPGSQGEGRNPVTFESDDGLPKIKSVAERGH